MKNGVTSAGELREVTTSLIEKLTHEEAEEMILDIDVYEVTYLMNSLQQEVKKLEEQASAVDVAYLTKGKASWVIACER